MNHRRVWISWERQRRSVEMARKLKCRSFFLEYSGRSRYPRCLLETIRILSREQPGILFVQNPSMFLAAFACIYGAMMRIPVVVDRHTTFLLTRKYQKTFRIFIFKLMHRFTLRYADLTIVTNEYLAGLVKSYGGNPFVLPDPLPHLMQSNNTLKLRGEKNIVMISSFSKDEPIYQVIEAAENLIDKKINLYITGNYNKFDKNLQSKVPENVVLTGFLSEQAFVDLLFTSDVIMVLTTSDFCMLCGCYEAVALGKPLITSEKKVLKDYFFNASFTSNDWNSIHDAIINTFSKLNEKKHEILSLKSSLKKKWKLAFERLEYDLYLLYKKY